MKKVLNFILNSVLYISVFYLAASVIKYIYLIFVHLIKFKRATIGCFYIDELIISIVVIAYMIKHIRIENSFRKYLK